MSTSLINPMIAYTLNQSVFSLGKAKLFYGDGNNDPFLAFSERETKDVKFAVKSLLNKVGISEPKGKIDFALLDVIERVAKHMGIGVGTGYGMASALSCRVIIQRHLLEQSKTPADKKFYREKLRVASQACVRTWESVYEDGFLAGLNKGGEEFGVLLQKCVSGSWSERQEDGSWKNLSGEETIDLLCKSYKEMSGLECPKEEMILILWSFRMARGYSALEKREEPPFYYTEEELLMMCIIGAFRRCGQGIYGRWIDYETEQTPGKGISVWSYLDDHWEEACLYIPMWLREKIYKASLCHIGMRAIKLSEARFFETNFQGNYNPEVPDHEALDNIPWIDIHDCHVSSSNTIILSQRGGLVEYSFEEMQGAFETKILYCPLKYEYEEDEEGNQIAVSCFMDGEPMKSILTDEGTLHYWVDVLPSREIIRKAALRYPDGVFLYSTGDSGKMQQYTQYINFNAFEKLGAFEGGSATGITLSLVNFLISISMKEEARPARWDSMARNMLTIIGGKIRAWVSKGAMKRIGRTGRIAQASKVMTSHSPRVENIDVEFEGELYNLPVCLVNPKDDLVALGNYTEGEIVAISRAPMIAKFYAIIKFDKKVSVGHVEVSALVWALTNRGDGDGDPIAVEPDEQIVAIV